MLHQKQGFHKVMIFNYLDYLLLSLIDLPCKKQHWYGGIVFGGTKTFSTFFVRCKFQKHLLALSPFSVHSIPFLKYVVSFLWRYSDFLSLCSNRPVKFVTHSSYCLPAVLNLLSQRLSFSKWLLMSTIQGWM